MPSRANELFDKEIEFKDGRRASLHAVAWAIRAVEEAHVSDPSLVSLLDRYCRGQRNHPDDLEILTDALLWLPSEEHNHAMVALVCNATFVEAGDRAFIIPQFVDERDRVLVDCLKVIQSIRSTFERSEAEEVFGALKIECERAFAVEDVLRRAGSLSDEEVKERPLEVGNMAQTVLERIKDVEQRGRSDDEAGPSQDSRPPSGRGR